MKPDRNIITKGFATNTRTRARLKLTIFADELLNFERAWLVSDDGLKRYDTLLRIAERESRAASSLATRLRITRQAVDHPTTAGRAIANHSTGRKPWDAENRFANNIRRSSSESDSI